MTSTAPAPSELEIIHLIINDRSFRATSQVRPDFWRAMARDEWESETLRIFDSFIDEQTVFFDIGAWMGPTTLYAAPAAAHVFCFEPDPVAFAELSRNIELNRDHPWSERIEAANKAVGTSEGTMRIGSQEGLGQSVSSALYHDEAGSVEVEVTRFDSLAEDSRLDGKKVFVKIDIEGGEYDLLMQSSKLLERPDSALCLSLHPRILRRRKRADSNYTPWAMVRRRLDFVHTHKKLLDRLPYRYFYTVDGDPLSTTGQLMRALTLGKFEREIVCTHEPWDGPEVDVLSLEEQWQEMGARSRAA